MEVTAKGKLTAINGELDGGIELTVEFVPSTDLENILLKDLLSDTQHDTVAAFSANFGEKFISRFVLAPKSLDAVRQEMALYSEWKRAGEMFDNKIVSFVRFKELKAPMKSKTAPAPKQSDK